jgi:transcription elongation factor Elf1
MNAVHEQGSAATMITFDCPWCAEPAMVEDSDDDDALTCNACGVRAELAADPDRERIAQAA